MPVVEIAKSLGVAYVLDGSVRKSGDRLRIAARLVRADTGYVVWTESYDRPFHDILMVQDDIAGEVTKALKASIETRPGH
jgi:TolB-like protein